MTDVITHGGLTVAKDLYDLVNDEILANGAISADQFWSGLDKAVHQISAERTWPSCKKGPNYKNKLINGCRANSAERHRRWRL